MEFSWKPIVNWPGKRTAKQERSRFSASAENTRRLVEAELRHLSARNVVMQADCEASEIRQDGRFRANARMRSSGIVISFDSQHGPLSFACDRYIDWVDNYRAIGMTMEALRAVSRHGVVKNAEQYKGWKALPAPPGSVVSTAATSSDVLAAATWLAEISTSAGVPLRVQQIRDIRELYEQARRAARSACHPDRLNGNRGPWNQLEAAMRILDAHHGIG